MCLNEFQTLFMPCGSFTAFHSKIYFFCGYLQLHQGQLFIKVPAFFRCHQTESAQMMQLIYCRKPKLPCFLLIMNPITHIYQYYTKVNCHFWSLTRFVLQKDFLIKMIMKQTKPYHIGTQYWRISTCPPSESHTPPCQSFQSDTH